MANHDLYEKNLLKALQDIAKSLQSIDSTLKIVDNYRKGYNTGFEAGVQEVHNRLKEEIINDY